MKTVVIPEKSISHPNDWLTPVTLTLVAASLQYYTPKCQSGGQILAPKSLRILAEWIGKPAPKLRALRMHMPLAAHICLLHAAGFVVHSRHFMPQPAITSWLHQSFPDNIDLLVDTLAHDRWLETVMALKLQDCITEDITAFLTQSLIRQQKDSKYTLNQLATWKRSDNEAWELIIPYNLPNWLHFDLRQLGQWRPGHPLICTPLTIAKAVQRGYGWETVQWIFETATGHSLPEIKKRQLRQWTGRASTYQIQTVRLLSTKQPDQMKQIMRQKRLREMAISQISSRHAIVKEGMEAPLEKWLCKQEYPLQKLISQADFLKSEEIVDESIAYQWLSLRVFIGLGEIIPLSTPAPHYLLDSLEARLDETILVGLEDAADKILHRLREAMRGRDAFFPAKEVPSQELVAHIEKCVVSERSLTIVYQALGERTPSVRKIQPLRLENRGILVYLYAYCYRSEMNLTFRLDRIKEIV